MALCLALSPPLVFSSLSPSVILCVFLLRFHVGLFLALSHQSDESFCFCAHLVVCCFVGVTPLPCTPCTPDTRFPQTPGVHTAHDRPFSVRARAHPRASVSVPRSFVSDRGSDSRRQAGRSHVWREGGGSRGRRRPRWARRGIRTGPAGLQTPPGRGWRGGVVAWGRLPGKSLVWHSQKVFPNAVWLQGSPD